MEAWLFLRYSRFVAWMPELPYVIGFGNGNTPEEPEIAKAGDRWISCFCIYNLGFGAIILHTAAS